MAVVEMDTDTLALGLLKGILVLLILVINCTGLGTGGGPW